MSDPTYQGYTTEPQTGYLQPDKVRVWFCCDRCGHEYSRVYDAVPRRNAPCPQPACVAAREQARAVRAARNVSGIVESGQAPGITGRNPMVGVIDQTAQMVMEDYKMTDLRDNLREGDAMAPSLPGNMQVAADSFFTGGVGQSNKQAALLTRRALGGAYRNMAVSPADVFPGTKGAPLLRRVS